MCVSSQLIMQSKRGCNGFNFIAFVSLFYQWVEILLHMQTPPCVLFDGCSQRTKLYSKKDLF